MSVAVADDEGDCVTETFCEWVDELEVDCEVDQDGYCIPGTEHYVNRRVWQCETEVLCF